MFSLLNDNPSLLLLLDHFEIDFTVGDQTVRHLCEVNGIHEPAFLCIGNLYNGFDPSADDLQKISDISSIIFFLQNSHRFYKNDKYPELKEYLARLHRSQNSNDIVLLEQFFQDYFKEVLEHLAYEEEVAFPYFNTLVNEGIQSGDIHYSVKDYRDHHTDIETKLADLKALLLKHVSMEGDLGLRRRFLTSLFTLEFDLNIHSWIEEMILLPLVEEREKGLTHG